MRISKRFVFKIARVKKKKKEKKMIPISRVTCFPNRLVSAGQVSKARQASKPMVAASKWSPNLFSATLCRDHQQSNPGHVSDLWSQSRLADRMSITVERTNEQMSVRRSVKTFTSQQKKSFFTKREKKKKLLQKRVKLVLYLICCLLAVVIFSKDYGWMTMAVFFFFLLFTDISSRWIKLYTCSIGEGSGFAKNQSRISILRYVK